MRQSGEGGDCCSASSATVAAPRVVSGDRHAIREERAITPAAECSSKLPRRGRTAAANAEIGRPAPGFYRSCRKLVEGPLRRLPRVYGNRLAYVRAYRQPVRSDRCGRFVQAYQRVQPLTMGELWAGGDHAARRARRESSTLGGEHRSRRAARQEADALADELLGVGDGRSAPTAESLARFESGPLVTAFACSSSSGSGAGSRSDSSPALARSRLDAQGTTPEDIVRVEHQRQAAMNVTGPQRDHEHEA